MINLAPRCFRMRSCILALFLLSSGALAAAESAWPVYRWEAQKIYRYEIAKRMEVSLDGQSKPRVTEMNFVLVFEVSAVDADGYATAEVRYATPRITLPPVTYFDASENEQQEDPLHPTRVARAMESVLSETRWPIVLAPNGSIRLREQPGDWRNWMQRVEQAGRWPKRVGNELAQLLDTHFSLTKDRAADDEWLPLLCDAPPGPRATGLRALRPRRSVRMGEADANGHLQLTLSRQPEEQPADVPIPLLDAQDVSVVLKRESVKSLEGTATFDTQLGLLDSATEHYQVHLLSRCGRLERRAMVDIASRILRLAPDLRKPTQAAGPARVEATAPDRSRPQPETRKPLR